jgi:hypothetical protein
VPAPMESCIKCYRVWRTRKMNFSMIDLENMNKHNKIFIICKDCNDGKAVSVLYDEDEFKEY